MKHLHEALTQIAMICPEALLSLLTSTGGLPASDLPLPLYLVINLMPLLSK